MFHPPIDLKDRPCWHCDRTGHLFKDCPSHKAIKACTEAPPARILSAVGPSRLLAAASTVGQGRFNGSWMVDEGQQMDAAIKEAEDETKQEVALQRLPETVRRSGPAEVSGAFGETNVVYSRRSQTAERQSWPRAETNAAAGHVGRFHQREFLRPCKIPTLPRRRDRDRHSRGLGWHWTSHSRAA